MILKHQKMNDKPSQQTIKYFPKTTLLITHYNRSASLENLLKSFNQIGCEFGDIVVSDDGSSEKHIEWLINLQQKYNFRLIKAIKNGGLGSNINKGQDAVTTEYTLYIQEDFEPTDNFLEYFTYAQKFMEEDIELDIIKFYAYYNYPYLKDYQKGFSKMYIPRFATDYTKIYAYSDHPHLRRSNFLKKFGRYPDGLKGDVTEYKMCISFLQNKGRGLFFNKFDSLFIQKNSEEEPSTMKRENWKFSKNLIISFGRYLYRSVKYNYDIIFMQPLKR